jgi:hypothetical protein
MAKHSLPSSARKSVLTATMALLALAPASGRALAQAEATPKPEAPAAAAPAVPPDEAASAAPTTEAAKPAPAVAPTCNCPPPCPAPPPPPPAPPVNPVEWKAQSKGGLLITSGNSQSKNFTFGVNASRKEGNNKLALDGGLAYGTSQNLVTNVDSSTNQITGIHREQVVSTNNWAAKGRYDRFITEHNTAYASGQAAADKIAGKTFYGGGQVGYSRQVLKDQWNIVVAELGYDFSYERYVQPSDSTLDPVAIHSARVLVGETLSLTQETGITASVEALFNLNKESKAIDVDTGNQGVKAFKDTRVNAKVGLSTNLYKQLSFGFSFALKYDQNPAPRPMPGGTPAGATFAPGFALGYADKVDTLTEASLIYTFF